MVFVIGLSLVFAAAMIVCVPLLRGAPAEAMPGDLNECAIRWEAQKRDAYGAIKEADLDFRIGKITPDEYRAIREAQEARALEALRELEREVPVGGEAVRACTKCGESVGAGLFCAACGAPVAP